MVGSVAASVVASVDSVAGAEPQPAKQNRLAISLSLSASLNKKTEINP